MSHAETTSLNDHIFFPPQKNIANALIKLLVIERWMSNRRPTKVQPKKSL